MPSPSGDTAAWTPPPGTVPGRVDPDVAAGHPGLGLCSWTTATTWPRRPPKALRDRLAGHADRIDGETALTGHEGDVAAAYRAFYRHLGRRGDALRPPLEVAHHRRLRQGGFPSRGAAQDIVLVVLLETGIPIWALDASAVRDAPGLRRLPEDVVATPGTPGPVPPRPEPAVVAGDVVVGTVGDLPHEAHRATRRTKRTTFCCVRVPGLRDELVDEAVRLCRSLAVCGTRT